MNILDVNDNPPIIDSPFGYNVSVSEVSTQHCLPSSLGVVIPHLGSFKGC